MKPRPLKAHGQADLRDVRASITMTAYLAEQMRSFGQSDLARVYDLVVLELNERCLSAAVTNEPVIENRLH